MKDKFITITGFNHYYGKQPFSIGNIIKCIKEESNQYDTEAIKAVLPYIGTVGYVANSPNTVAGGIMSAGRLYDHVRKKFYARVMFTTASKIICRLEEYKPELFEKELQIQMKQSNEDKEFWD
ncbi:MAG: HIRAN domain-containing protein [Lachnospiraceae bacterium]|nr:HIRAN domain-containing protein [Lachnospiraceae bacterium]